MELMIALIIMIMITGLVAPAVMNKLLKAKKRSAKISRLDVDAFLGILFRYCGILVKR